MSRPNFTHVVMIIILGTWFGMSSVHAQVFSFLFPEDPVLPDVVDIDLDTDGNLYTVSLTRLGGGLITKLDPEGRVIFRIDAQAPGSAPGQFRNPFGIAVDAMRRIYVADTFNHRIQVFESDGDFLFTFGTVGNTLGELIEPRGITVDAAGQIYVADQGNHRIHVFDSSGNALFAFGGRAFQSIDNGRFRRLEDVAVDAMQRIYAADSSTGRIQVFDASGNFLFAFGGRVRIEGRFPAPRSLAIDGMQRIYAADGDNGRILVFDASGQFLFAFGTPGPGSDPGQLNVPRGLAVDATKRLYVVHSGVPPIQVFDIDGNFLFTRGHGGSAEGKFADPSDLAINAMNHVYIVDQANSRIQVFDADGKFRFAFGEPGTAAGQFIEPTNIAIDAMQRVYVVDQGNLRVQVFDASGDFLFAFGGMGVGDGQFLSIEDIAIDAMQRVYVTGDDNVKVFDADGKFHFQFSGTTCEAGMPFAPQAIVIDAMQRIYVKEGGVCTQVFDTDGNFLFQSAILPQAVDAMQRLYTTGDNRVSVFDANGKALFTFGERGVEAGQFIEIGQVAVNAMNRIYVIDRGNSRIQVFGNLVDVISFEDIPTGNVVKKVYADGGFGPIKVYGKLGDHCRRNAAVVFDSSCPGGICSSGDQDLGTPNETLSEFFGGPGIGQGGEKESPWFNDTPLGHLLIVHEHCRELTRRRVARPDDARGESVIRLKFPQPVRILSYTIIDHESNESDHVKLYGKQGKRLGAVTSPATGDNGKAVVQTTSDGYGISGVTRMVFKRQGSRGLDNIVFIPEAVD